MNNCTRFSKVAIVILTDFFFSCSTGRILNRFSKDISQIDSTLLITFVDVYQVRPVYHFLRNTFLTQ